MISEAAWRGAKATGENKQDSGECVWGRKKYSAITVKKQSQLQRCLQCRQVLQASAKHYSVVNRGGSLQSVEFTPKYKMCPPRLYDKSAEMS